MASGSRSPHAASASRSRQLYGPLFLFRWATNQRVVFVAMGSPVAARNLGPRDPRATNVMGSNESRDSKRQAQKIKSKQMLSRSPSARRVPSLAGRGLALGLRPKLLFS